MDDLVAGNLRIERLGDDKNVVLQWRGSSTDRNPSLAINPYVRGIYDAVAGSGASVEMRFESLDHFNSSTITALIQMIQEARTRKIKLVLTYDAAVKWQRLSFEALRVFAKDELLTLRSVSPS